MVMQALLDEQDYQVIAGKVLDLIKEDYDLVPKQRTTRYISFPQFRAEQCIKKSPAWCRLYLLPKMAGVYGLNTGKGHHIRIDSRKAAAWLDEHEDEIDWNQPLP
jgi:hypothetical protein